MRSYLIVSYLLLSVFWTFTGVTRAADLPNHRFIHASGEVVRAYVANIGEINFELTEFNANPETCFEAMLKDSEEIFHLLAESGIANADIQAAQIKRYTSPAEHLETPENQKKYRLTRTFNVVVRDLEKWDAIIKTLAIKPYLGSFVVNFGRSDLAQVQAEMLGFALEEAKGQARNIANSLAVKLDVVTGVSQSPLTSVSSALGLTGNAPMRDRGPKIAAANRDFARDFSVPASLRFTMHVNLMYKIK